LQAWDVGVGVGVHLVRHAGTDVRLLLS
jgi:hypothetical protein